MAESFFSLVGYFIGRLTPPPTHTHSHRLPSSRRSNLLLLSNTSSVCHCQRCTVSTLTNRRIHLKNGERRRVREGGSGALKLSGSGSGEVEETTHTLLTLMWRRHNSVICQHALRHIHTHTCIHSLCVSKSEHTETSHIHPLESTSRFHADYLTCEDALNATWNGGRSVVWVLPELPMKGPLVWNVDNIYN